MTGVWQHIRLIQVILLSLGFILTLVMVSSSARAQVPVVETNNVLTGSVTDTSKKLKPIVGRAVRLVAVDGSLAGLGITDTNGNYTITGFKAGTYSVVIPDEIEIVKKKQVLKSPTKITVPADTGFSQTVGAKVKPPKTVPVVDIKVIDPNAVGATISGATVQYVPVVGKKAKAVKATTPTSLAKLKPGCYSFTTTKLVGYYLNATQSTRTACFDQYGPTGQGEGYQIVFFQSKVADNRCDKQAQTGIDDFWFCGAKIRATLSDTTSGYQVVWKRIVTKIAELRTSYGPTNVPEQVAIASDPQITINETSTALANVASANNTSCPLPRQSGGTEDAIPNPDKAERLTLPNYFGYPMLDTAKKNLQPQYQKQIDAMVTFGWASIRDWRMGSCKDFGSKNTATTYYQLYNDLITNYPQELDDALNLNRYMGSGANGLYPNPITAKDPSKVYATTFTVGTILKTEFEANIKDQLNNQNSTPYKSGASDVLKKFVAETTKKL